MILIATLPGALGISGAHGSFIRPDVEAAALEIGAAVRFMDDETPTSRQVRRFVRRGDRRGRSLMLCGKSMGGVKSVQLVLKRVYQEFGGYEKVALYTVDPFGLGWGKGQVRGNLELPGELVRNKDYFRAVNLYQRTGGMEGALVQGAQNHRLDKFPDGKKVTHMNIVDHPAVKVHARSLLVWLST